jgi:protocatechuate 3,4-dioxygenase beta subunit
MRRAFVLAVLLLLVAVVVGVVLQGSSGETPAPPVEAANRPTTTAPSAPETPPRPADEAPVADSPTPAPPPPAPVPPEDPRSVEARGTVRGRVLDADGRPVEGATVAAVAAHVIVIGSITETTNYQHIGFVPVLATTDAEGRYELARVPMGGAYQIHAAAPNQGGSSRVDVHVADETPVVAPDLAFKRRASLTVTILGPDGARVDDAELSIDWWRGSSAPSRVAGVHRVDPIEPRSWTLVATKAPFGCASEHVEIAPGAAAVVTLRLSEGGESVTGVVVDDAGAPIAGASVRVKERSSIFDSGFYNEEEERPTRVVGISQGVATTDAEGRFRVAGLRRGLHEVAVAADGHHGTRESTLMAVSEDVRFALLMAPSEDVRFVLARHAAATLRLVPTGGAPLPTELALRSVLAPVRMDRFIERGAVVRDWKAPWNEGVARFTGLLAGPGSVRAHAAGFVPVERAVDPKPGDVLELGEAVLAPSLALTGRVVDPDGRPIVGATVFRHDRTAAATTDERGVFRLLDQPPGDVGVHADAHGFAGVNAAGASGGDAAAFVVTLQRAAIFRGRVLDQNGRPCPETELAIFTSPIGPRQPCVGDCFTDHRGVFERELAPGKYRIGTGWDARSLGTPKGEEFELKPGETSWIVLRR